MTTLNITLSFQNPQHLNEARTEIQNAGGRLNSPEDGVESPATLRIYVSDMEHAKRVLKAIGGLHGVEISNASVNVPS
jgi:hypothetical protein